MPLAPLLLALALAAAPARTAPARAPAPAFRVVVHASNSTPRLSRAELADLFLKKTTRWASGARVLPVDQAEGRPVREAFSERVLERSVRAVLAYWQQRLFSGRDVPPPQKASDADVLAYVRNHPGAVGYVSPRAPLSGVKVVAVTE